jgi:hypothetical protein
MVPADFQLIVYDCPPPQRGAVVEVLNDHELDFEYELLGSQRSHAELMLGRLYTARSFSGFADDIGTQLIDRAAGATFAGWTEPAQEYLGTAVMYAPDLGKFIGECDANGHPLLGRWQLRELIGDQEKARLKRIAAAIDRAAGGPWLDRFEQLGRSLP